MAAALGVTAAAVSTTPIAAAAVSATATAAAAATTTTAALRLSRDLLGRGHLAALQGLGHKGMHHINGFLHGLLRRQETVDARVRLCLLLKLAQFIEFRLLHQGPSLPPLLQLAAQAHHVTVKTHSMVIGKEGLRGLTGAAEGGILRQGAAEVFDAGNNQGSGKQTHDVERPTRAGAKLNSQLWQIPTPRGALHPLLQRRPCSERYPRMIRTSLLLAALTGSLLAADNRLGPLKDLDGYFPFNPPNSLSQWDQRREEVRQRILVSQGLWPMPTKTDLKVVRHGRIEGDGYAVEKVYFQSAPGFFVTGNLWMPKSVKGKIPCVLFAHGHWQDARLSLNDEDKVRAEIAIGAERFEQGGRSIFQSLCVQLARMGCAVWQWDMLSDSDSIQIPREVVHRFATQRPEMNTLENWGLYSPQAEAHLQSIMGLQTWNAIRGLDFVLSLPEVDPKRIAITGASGGGTQTMLLAAIDDRIALSFPCVMVSTSMQGGCTCENASLLRIGTGNVEFAALFAPKPQGMNSANDWTREMATKGFPELQSLYALHGAKDKVMLLRGEHFLHNYNAVTRSAFYSFLNTHFKLGQKNPVIERDHVPLSREQLSVWDKDHPAPKAADPDFERQLLSYFTHDSQSRLQNSDESVLRAGVQTVLGRRYEEAGEGSWLLNQKEDKGDHLLMTGLLRNDTHNEECRMLWLYPKSWKGRVVIWLEDQGQNGFDAAKAKPLLDQGIAVGLPTLLMQERPLNERTATVKSPREFAGYTHGYNHSLFAKRVHDVLSVLNFVRQGKVKGMGAASWVGLLAQGEQTGPIATAVRALAPEAIDAAAIHTHGFRFSALLDWRHPSFTAGGAKYNDLPGMLALAKGRPLHLKGEGKDNTEDPVVWLAKAKP